MKLCFFPYVEGWAPCCSVDDKGGSACNSSSIRGKDDFFKSEIWKKSFQLDRRQKIRRRIVLEIFPKKMQNFSFKVEARDDKFR